MSWKVCGKLSKEIEKGCDCKEGECVGSDCLCKRKNKKTQEIDLAKYFYKNPFHKEDDFK